MNQRMYGCALVVLGLLLADPRLALAQIYAGGHNYYAGVDYLMLGREESDDASRNLIYSDNNASQDVPIQPITRPQGVALSATDLDFDTQSGIRVIFGAQLACNCGRLEASYFTLTDDWVGTADLTMGDYSFGTQLQNNNQNPNAVNIDTTVASVQNLLTITAVQATRRSDLSGFEFNYVGAMSTGRWHYNPIVGIRYFSLTEDLRMNLTTAGGNAIFDSNAENWIIGPQVGGELGCSVYRCGNVGIDFSVIGKGGIGANFAEASYHLQNADPANNPDAPDDSQDSLAPFAELAVRAQISWGRLTARLGYEAVVLSNVELGGVPPDLFIFGADPVTANDTVFYHGFSAGGILRF